MGQPGLHIVIMHTNLLCLMQLNMNVLDYLNRIHSTKILELLCICHFNIILVIQQYLGLQLQVKVMDKCADRKRWVYFSATFLFLELQQLATVLIDYKLNIIGFGTVGWINNTSDEVILGSRVL